MGKVPKPHNGGTWTDARKRSFIMSALRRAQWPPKYAAIKEAYIDDGINPETGRRCKLHRCSECNDCFPAKDMQADHTIPVIPLDGFDSWDGVIERLFCEKEGYTAMCKACHKVKTQEENAERRARK
jgi:5-methylcytosine-specific restriction endonuclease McrA